MRSITAVTLRLEQFTEADSESGALLLKRMERKCHLGAKRGPDDRQAYHGAYDRQAYQGAYVPAGSWGGFQVARKEAHDPFAN
jgi:hypothetical protein